MKKYGFIKCTDEKIDELHERNQIRGFRYGCSVDDTISKTICVQQDGRDIALLDYSIENKEMQINEFEIVVCERKCGHGKNIISIIQEKCELDAICLYPKTEGAKEFWNKCSFEEIYEETGVMQMEWKRNT